jgi:glycosyltransferase involved in cell wall biosynthesis
MEKLLKIAHVVDEGAWGGLATFLVNLLNSQSRDPAVSELHLVCDPTKMDPALKTIPLHMHVYGSDRRFHKAPAIARTIRDYLGAIDPDVVILHSSFPGLWGRIAPRGRWKTIYCAHGLAYLQKVGFVRSTLYRIGEVILGWRCDALVSISHNEYQAAGAAGIRVPVHRMIPHGIQPKVAPGGPVLDIKNDRINLAFIGRYDLAKGFDILLHIFDDPRLDRMDLWIVGKNIIDNRVEVPRKPNIHEVGWLPNEEVGAVIRQIDAVIIPSRSEGFGLVALEAMRSRRPAIANAVGGLKELIGDGVNGRLIDIYDIEACRKILLNLRKPELERMGVEGERIFLANYLWERCYAQWRDLIAEVAG